MNGKTTCYLGIQAAESRLLSENLKGVVKHVERITERWICEDDPRD